MKKGWLSELTREQKTGFVLLLIFGFLTVGLGVLQMRNNIYLPFAIGSTESESGQISLADDATRLQRIDTDHDGINDYEELEFYATSPYLPDSDSDGIDDKVEIEAGTDPLCPEGEECSWQEDELPAPESVLEDSLAASALTAADIIGASGLGSSTTTIDINTLINNPDYLREVLLSGGQISEEQLAGVSDEELLELVNSIINN